MNENNSKRVATRVSLVGMVGNILLTAFKLAAGLISGSGAMISDAVHSASDAFSGVIVIAGVRFSAKESDDRHPYGHERFECVAEIILSVVLFIAGVTIGVEAAKSIIGGDYRTFVFNNPLALIAAVITGRLFSTIRWRLSPP